MIHAPPPFFSVARRENSLRPLFRTGRLYRLPRAPMQANLPLPMRTCIHTNIHIYLIHSFSFMSVACKEDSLRALFGAGRLYRLPRAPLLAILPLLMRTYIHTNIHIYLIHSVPCLSAARKENCLRALFRAWGIHRLPRAPLQAILPLPMPRA